MRPFFFVKDTKIPIQHKVSFLFRVLCVKTKILQKNFCTRDGDARVAKRKLNMFL